jgi:hypothetical protein
MLGYPAILQLESSSSEMIYFEGIARLFILRSKLASLYLILPSSKASGMFPLAIVPVLGFGLIF